MSFELLAEQIEQLKAPFNPEDISWKPQTVDYKNKTALAVAYADPRAYIDRLDEVFGVGKWSDSYTFIATPFTKVVKGKKAWGDAPATEDKSYAGDKVVCVCYLRIPEYDISLCSTGDSDASDDNAATSAEAQAFKRACMKLGIGRYLYELPKLTAAYDKNRWVNGPPTLPDSAVPKFKCQECANVIVAFEHDGKQISVSQLITNSKKKYDQKLCANCQRKRSEGIVAARVG